MKLPPKISGLLGLFLNNRPTCMTTHLIKVLPETLRHKSTVTTRQHKNIDRVNNRSLGTSTSRIDQDTIEKFVGIVDGSMRPMNAKVALAFLDQDGSPLKLRPQLRSSDNHYRKQDMLLPSLNQDQGPSLKHQERDPVTSDKIVAVHHLNEHLSMASGQFPKAGTLLRTKNQLIIRSLLTFIIVVNPCHFVRYRS
jgi:hypothetical protein